MKLALLSDYLRTILTTEDLFHLPEKIPDFLSKQNLVQSLSLLSYPVLCRLCCIEEIK